MATTIIREKTVVLDAVTSSEILASSLLLNISQLNSKTQITAAKSNYTSKHFSSTSQSSSHHFCFNFPLKFHPKKPSNDFNLFEAHFSAATNDETSREITSPPMMNAPKSATKNNFFLYPLEHNGK
jgi:hypothetical protein